MLYAEIAVTSRTSRATGAFTYSVPANLNPVVGTLVWVPFGQRLSQGIVVALADAEPPFPTKDIFALCGPLPVLSPAQIALARWIADHYCCSLSAAVNQMLPAELRQKATPLYSLAGEPSGDVADPRPAGLVAALGKGPRTASELQALAPGKEGAKALRSLVAGRPASPSRGPSLRPRRRPRPNARCGWRSISRRFPPPSRRLSRAPRQAAALRWLADHTGDGGPSLVATVCEGSGANLADPSTIWLGTVMSPWPSARLSAARLVAEDLRRVPLPTLTPTQAGALRTIAAAVRESQSKVISSPRRHRQRQGRGVLCTRWRRRCERESGRSFWCRRSRSRPRPSAASSPALAGGSRCFHSRLSAGEHLDEWRRVRAGQADVVIGSRSALFAPVDNLGLVVVDEEHEWAYKQGEPSRAITPARRPSRWARSPHAPVVLGSATPDVCTYYRATETTRYTLSN